MAELLTDPGAPDPVLPGAWFVYESQRAAAVPQSPGATVLVPFTADWGPENTVVPMLRFSDFADGTTLPDGTRTDGFGPNDTPGRRRVFDAFYGEGIPGRGGAGRVLGYRMAAAAAARASKQLGNTTPATPALTLTAKWKGTRGNSFAVTTRNSATVGMDELLLFEGSRLAESYEYTDGDINALAAMINAQSELVTAVANISGVALATVTASTFAGGLDGDTLTAGEYTSMLNALEFEPFGIFAAAGIVDPAIITSLIAWKNDVRSRGKSVRLAIGGPAAETFTAHRTRALGYNDPDVLAFGTGNIVDTVRNADGSAATISTAEGIGRVAGAMARRGEEFDMVNVRFDGWAIAPGTGANRAQAELAASSGQSVLVRDGDPEAPTKIPLGVTSYSSNTAAKPFAIYSVQKFIATIHGLETDIIADQEGGGDELIDGRGITDKSRDLVLGRARAVINDRMERGILQPGSGVGFDPERPFTPTSTSVALVYDAVFVRGLRGIRNRIRVG